MGERGPLSQTPHYAQVRPHPVGVDAGEEGALKITSLPSFPREQTYYKMTIFFPTRQGGLGCNEKDFG